MRHALKLDRADLRPAKHPMLYDLALKGASKSVRSAVKEIESTLNVRVRSTRRFLLFPAEIVAALVPKEIGRGQCTVRVTPRGGKSRFGAGLWESELAQVEVLGPVDACDEAEDRCVAFVKVFQKNFELFSSL